MSPQYRRALLAFCLLGLGASTAAAYVHYRMLIDPTYVSLCDVSATVNCQSVYRSVYGSVRGVPISLIGTLWFVLIGLLAWFDVSAGNKAKPASAPTSSAIPGYLFVLATVALAVVLYLAYASWFVLKTVCIYCILTYVAVIGIFVVSGAAFKAGFGTLPSRAATDTRRLLRSPLGLSISAVYAALAVAAIMLFPREATVSASAPSGAMEAAPVREIPAPQLSQFEQYMAAQTRVPVAIATDGAAVLIVKFNDYQCPPCRQTYMEYTPIVEKYHKSHPGKVKFVTKDFPLEAECNTGGVHVAACEAAAAVRMARARNRADEMEAWLFQNQGTMSPDLVRSGVRQVAGVTDFDAQYPKTLEQVRADVALGRQLGVGRTPTFFINGVKIEGGLRPEYFEAAIVYELRRAEAKP